MSICSCTFKYFAHDLGKFEYQLLVSIYRMIHELCLVFYTSTFSKFTLHIHVFLKKNFSEGECLNFYDQQHVPTGTSDLEECQCTSICF